MLVVYQVPTDGATSDSVIKLCHSFWHVSHPMMGFKYTSYKDSIERKVHHSFNDWITIDEFKKIIMFFLESLKLTLLEKRLQSLLQ